MYCNLTKYYTSSVKPRVSEPCNRFNFFQALASTPPPPGLYLKPLRIYDVSKARNFSDGLHFKIVENKNVTTRKSSTGSFSKKYSQNSRGTGDGKTLPWITAYDRRKTKASEKMPTVKTGRSTWEESARSYFYKNTPVKDVQDSSGGRPRRTEEAQNDRGGYSYNTLNDVREEEEDPDQITDPRWDRIKDRCKRVMERGSERPDKYKAVMEGELDRPEKYKRVMEREPDRPEVRHWNKQEDWGRKTWREATVSSIPKTVGEGVYGVGPVLAAVTVGRRELYTLYVQEGLDLSSNNRKKKDKRGMEKVLQKADEIGLTIKEMSKHDLNMMVDNRPHQGFVLDASPLEMVTIRELDPVSAEEDRAPLWVALDEVTDPQNLGAIARSAYFFGAAGIVLCAKNSAPLSGVVSKASAGALELVELRSCKNMMQFLTSSGENGWRVLGGSVSAGAVPLNEVKSGEPTILVLGSEGTGLRPLVERSCQQLIRIPGNLPLGAQQFQDDNKLQKGKEFISFLAVESLNVSVATGILLYHLAGNFTYTVGEEAIASTASC